MNVTFEYIGWCNEKDSKGDHDKVWAAFKMGNSWYACWGARGKTVNFKKHDSFNSLRRVIDSKRGKYGEVSETKLLDIWPDFYDSVESRLVFCTLANKIM